MEARHDEIASQACCADSAELRHGLMAGVFECGRGGGREACFQLSIYQVACLHSLSSGRCCLAMAASAWLRQAPGQMCGDLHALLYVMSRDQQMHHMHHKLHLDVKRLLEQVPPGCCSG
jgi:hypothetical protein